MVWSCLLGTVFCLGVGSLGLGESCFLGVELEVGRVEVWGVGVGGGVLEVVLLYDLVGVEEPWSHLFGSISVLSQDGDKTRLATFIVGCLDCVLWFSGLSLALLRALP